MARHWTKEDEILALDLYFRAGPQNDVGEEETAEIKTLTGAGIKTIKLKLLHLCRLNLTDPREGEPGVSALLREVWGEYCWDKKWMKGRLAADAPPPVYTNACRDLKKLRRDAAKIIRERTPPDKISRREARQEAVRILYAAAAQNISAAAAFALLRENEKTAREKMLFEDSLLSEIVSAADSRREEIGALLKDAAGRAPELISGVELAAIRAAAAEMLSRPQIRRAVVINEAVEIAKQFGAEGGHKIVNGALDKIAARLGEKE